MDTQDFFAWQSSTSVVSPFAGDDEIAADVDEPPDHILSGHVQHHPNDFQKSMIRPQQDRKESLLTKAFHLASPTEAPKPDIRLATDLARRRSIMSIASAASTADLTSDGGITSPARTTTPSPPYPTTTYMKLAPFVMGKPPTTNESPVIRAEKDSSLPHLPTVEEIPKPDVVAEAPRKRCISFSCAPQKPQQPLQTAPKLSPPAVTTATAEKPQERPAAPKRCTTIKFACAAPKKEETPDNIVPLNDTKPEAPPLKRCPTISFACQAPKKQTEEVAIKPEQALPTIEEKSTQTQALKIATPSKPQRHHSRSPSINRKTKNTPPPLKHRDSNSTVRQASRSPVVTRRTCTRKPTYITADESDLVPSEATRFHEFASDEPQEDDWITNDHSETKARLTINDTLRKENAIRQLGKEAEEEALEDEEEDDEVNDSEDEDDDEDAEEDGEVDESFVDRDAHDSEDELTDGNETDNEAGFAESDDESDGADGIYQFWTPGRSSLPNDASRFAQAPIAASESSIDSLKHMSPVARMKIPMRKSRPRKMEFRPGTPDLPDSTDFVCGTLDEDRPLETAYLSCMEQRRREKHRTIPQDIDPSFPTSDFENDDEEDNDDVGPGKESDTEVWLHGKFEDSDGSGPRRRRSVVKKSPKLSPRRMHSPPPQHKRLGSPAPVRRLHSPPPPTKKHHSPPPQKKKHHSPPPQKKKLGSPPPPKKRMGSPPPPKKRHASPPPKKREPSPSRRLFDSSALYVHSPTKHTTQSPPGSMVHHSAAITFAPLGGTRPGITHTKSLPRTPNAFCRAYRAARLVAANGNIADGSDNNDGHTRGAIDILNGLQTKRERRREKLYQKQCNRARKSQQVQRRPLPGKGAERMRELGCALAGKTDSNKKAAYVTSI